jgi:hypothetical protein
MATVNLKSNIVTNLDATPKVLNSLNIMGAVLREQVATVEIAAGDDNTSTYRLGRVHSSWRISELTMFNDAIQSGSDFDLGLYATAEDGGSAVDANAYSDAVTLVSGSLVGVQNLFEAGSPKGVEDIEQAVWQDAGLTADPGVWYDVVLTSTTVGSGAGTVSLRMRYVANS